MRRQDLDALNAPYGTTTNRRDDRFGDALALHLAEVRSLENALYDDLDPVSFGVQWWRDYEPRLGVRARIYISDYLYRSAHSIEQNLIEAKLHLLEALDAFEQDDRRHSDMLSVGPRGERILRTPPSRSALDDLPQHLSTLHTAGFFRALASAFDCLGACIHGVLALGGPILETSFGRARGTLRGLAPDPQRDIERKAVAQRIEDIITSAGPSGWLVWLLDYRHMLVHRARRYELITVGVDAPLLDQHGHPILRTRSVNHLARDPARSDVEVWRDVQTSPVLNESARTTMEEILASSQIAIREISGELLSFWNWRRQNIAALPQPANQWANDFAGNVTGFPGYEPRQAPFQPESMSGNPRTLQRLRVASLSDGAHRNWPDFGGRGSSR